MTSAAGFKEIWVLDFEFSAQSGEDPDPVCMVAHEIGSGRRLRLWRNELITCPFDVGPETLFVAYFASAELKCFRTLGWPTPERVLDLYAEYRLWQNGNTCARGYGLLDAAAAFGIKYMGATKKTTMRNLILSGGPWSTREQLLILNYCEADVKLTTELFRAMWPAISAVPDGLGQALFRGRYMTSVAVMESNGIPLDQDLLSRLRENWSEIKAQLIARIDSQYGVYDGARFVRQK
ncbi:hypothetical protein MWU53_14890 [Aliiroseovarius sp. S1123]|nr:hypothetical protein [Aliiroseovarius sp. S1123]